MNLNDRSPEYLSLFIDEMLKKGVKGVCVCMCGWVGQCTCTLCICGCVYANVVCKGCVSVSVHTYEILMLGEMLHVYNV